MKQVLIVDDDQGFLLSLADMLKDKAEEFTVLTANNGKQAAEAMEQNQVDLVVTDLKMPEMDGFELLAHLSSRQPDVPLIAMTAYGTQEMEDRLLEMGAFQYVEKPIDFELLLEKINAGLEAAAKGHVSGVSLASYVQLLQLDSKTCTLQITYGEKSGILYFDQGELVNAISGSLDAPDAAREILSWEPVEIEIQNFCKNRERLIEEPLPDLLPGSARRLGDSVDSTADASKSPSQETYDLLDDLDFVFPNLSKNGGQGEAQASAPSPPKSQAPAQGKSGSAPAGGNTKAPVKKPRPKGVVGKLLDHVGDLPGVKQMVLLSRKGRILYKENITSAHFIGFLGYVAMTAEQIKTILGSTGLHSVVMEKDSGEGLILVIGPQFILGLGTEADASPSDIADHVRSAVKRIKIQ